MNKKLSEENPPKCECNFCGAEYTYENSNDPNVIGRDTTKHSDWCIKIARRIYDRFNATFREIYNVIELSLDDKRAETAKDLIGNTIMETRNDCTNIVVNYFVKNGVESVSKL
jgi:hypothetical protein